MPINILATTYYGIITIPQVEGGTIIRKSQSYNCIKYKIQNLDAYKTDLDKDNDFAIGVHVIINKEIFKLYLPLNIFRSKNNLFLKPTNTIKFMYNDHILILTLDNSFERLEEEFTNYLKFENSINTCIIL